MSEKGVLLADPDVELIGIPDLNADKQSMHEIAYDAAVDTFEAKAKNANYFKISGSDPAKDLRFRNQDVSAYVLANTLVKQKDSPYTQNDAAILWYKSQITEGVEVVKGRGNEVSNLAETTTKIASA